MQAKREASARHRRPIHRADPDFPTTQALQQRLLAEGRISREAVPRPVPVARSPDAALPASGLRTIANFRRALAIPGVQVVRLDTPEPSRRTVAVLQSNAVAFRVAGRSDAPSWLWFGSARDWRFAGNRAIRLHPDDGEPLLIYELHLPSGIPLGTKKASRQPA